MKNAVFDLGDNHVNVPYFYDTIQNVCVKFLSLIPHLIQIIIDIAVANILLEITVCYKFSTL